MVERIVYFGPFNNHKKNELFHKSIEYLRDNKSDKFYYLLPNGELLKSYRRKLIHSVENTFEINVLTFDDIVSRIVKNSTKKTISNPMKNFIIKHALTTLAEEGNIDYFKNVIFMDGFIKSCNSIIGEIKRSLVSVDTYLDKCPELVEFKEIGKIYCEYERILEGLNFSDREGDYLRCVNLLKNDTTFLMDIDYIIIDEFYDFRPIEMAILKELLKMDINIYINIPFQTKNGNPIINSTLEKLKNLGFKIEIISKEDDNSFEKLASFLFTGERENFDYINNLQLIKSSSIYLEVKKIFEEIKIHCLNGIQLHDIGIVVTNNMYLEPLYKVADEEGIPITKAKSMPLMDIGLVKEFLNILENVIMNGAKISVVNRVKSAYFPILEKRLSEALEFLVRKQDFQTIDDLKSIVLESQKFNFPLEYYEPFKKYTLELLEEMSNIPQISTVEDYIEILLDLLKKYEIDNKLLNRYKAKDDFKLYRKDLKVIEELRKAINHTGALSHIRDRITLEDYYIYLKDYLSEIEIVEENGHLMGVKVFDPVNTRGFKNKVLFITGLSQGNYPNLKSDNYLLKDENITTIKSLNIEYKDYENRFSNESLKFASSISACTSKLYFTYSGNSEGEGLGIPSVFLDEVFTLLKGDKIEEKLNTEIVDLDYLIKSDINKITNNKDLSNYLLYNYFNDEIIPQEYFSLHNYIYKSKLLTINSKLKSEIGRLTNEFDIFRGKLNDKNIIEDISSKLEKKIYSISYLESYSKCPFFFFLNNYFKIEEIEREFEKYSPMDIGSIYHRSLRWYYLKYYSEIRERVLNDLEFPYVSSFENLKLFLESMFLEYDYDLVHNKNKIILESVYNKLIKFIIADIDRLSNSKERLIPYEFELQFGKEQEFEIKSDGESVPMVGIIDRIDKLVDKDAYVVMDYKSSSYGVRNLDHMKSGLSLQLPVYIMSNINRDVVAGIYGVIGGPKFEVPIGILEKSKVISKSHKGGMNQEEWEEFLEGTGRNIVKIVKGIKAGDFSVNPLECSPYCIYKDICRYEKTVEVEG